MEAVFCAGRPGRCAAAVLLLICIARCTALVPANSTVQDQPQDILPAELDHLTSWHWQASGSGQTSETNGTADLAAVATPAIVWVPATVGAAADETAAAAGKAGQAELQAGEGLGEATEEEFDRPFPPMEPNAYLWWILILYMFFVMAVVCDDYLVPTVDIMCELFRIPEDVAGATLMAFACNGPELLTNTCAIFVTHSSMGMGTIVGSAIFNVMVIVGACPLAAPGGVLDIPKSTYIRDASFSAISIVILAWALPVIDFTKASVLLGMSFVYVVVVAKFRTWFGSPGEDELLELDAKLAQRKAQFAPRKLERRLSEAFTPSAAMYDEDDPPFRRSATPDQEGYFSMSGGGRRMRRSRRLVSAQEAYNMGPENRKEIWSENEIITGAVPSMEPEASSSSRVLAWTVFLLTSPTHYTLAWTIPDVKVESKKGKYVSAFFSSMFWLSTTALVVCWGSDAINYYWGIPQSFLGLTLAAAGTSFPNMLASMITAKTGRGPIAVSNALGSNVQNIFLVLALPIWVRVLQTGEYVMGGDDINSSIVWMGVTLALCTLTVAAQGWTLNTKAGYFFFLIYIIYVVQTTVSSSGS